MKKISLDSVTNGLIFLYILSIYIFTYREGYNIISNALALLVVLTVWIGIFISGKKIRFNLVLLLQLLFIVFCLFTALYAISPSTVISKVKTLMLIFLVMLTLVNYIDTQEKLKKIIVYFIISGFVSGVCMLLNSDFSSITRYGRELGNQNAVGMNIAISAVFCFYFILSEKKYLYALSYFVMIPCILLTGSRKSLIFLVCSIVLVLYLTNRNSFTKLLKFILILVFVVLIFNYLIFQIPIFYQIIGERIENLFSFISGKGTEEASMNIRYNMTRLGLDFFINRPLYGYGIDNYRFLYGNTYSHNNFIELLVGTGIFGFLLFYLTNIILVRHLLRLSKNRELELICFTLLAIIVSYILLSPSLVYYDSKHFNILLTMASSIGSEKLIHS